MANIEIYFTLFYCTMHYGHVVGTEKRLSRSCLAGGRFFLNTWRNSIVWMGVEPSIKHLPGKFRLIFSRHIDIWGNDLFFLIHGATPFFGWVLSHAYIAYPSP